MRFSFSATVGMLVVCNGEFPKVSLLPIENKQFPIEHGCRFLCNSRRASHFLLGEFPSAYSLQKINNSLFKMNCSSPYKKSVVHFLVQWYILVSSLHIENRKLNCNSFSTGSPYWKWLPRSKLNCNSAIDFFFLYILVSSLHIENFLSLNSNSFSNELQFIFYRESLLNMTTTLTPYMNNSFSIGSPYRLILKVGLTKS